MCEATAYLVNSSGEEELLLADVDRVKRVNKLLGKKR